ncbi:hypothetical protein Pph01_06550 [Planotetraspora phitsanulokensis]|uniref:Uncharacterized protein n=1 Tax=Planotetraspora phitsanulokensis TaxID=575192 RepID=A0A8J3U2A0_9ACTN|nr:hypothetical protein Pph01_06550 [Planotetraspora phitsanulokensis]
MCAADRPLVRRGQGGRITVACRLGYLVWSIEPASWAGSWYRATLTACTGTCDGALTIPTTTRHVLLGSSDPSYR